jgi:hypothetical protein
MSKQTFEERAWNAIYEAIEQHYYIDEEDLGLLMFTLTNSLNNIGKLRNTTDDLLTYEEYLKFTKTKENKNEC